MGDVTVRQREVIVLDYSIFSHNGHMLSVIFIFAIDLLICDFACCRFDNCVQNFVLINCDENATKLLFSQKRKWSYELKKILSTVFPVHP